MEVNIEAPLVDEETETTAAPQQPPSPPPPPVEDDVDPFCEENDGLFEIMKMLNFTVQPRQSKSNPGEVPLDGDRDARIGDRECSGCTGEKLVDDLFKKLEADVVSEKEREIEQLASDLKNEREAGMESEKKITKLVEFISFIHGEFGKLVRSIVALTTKNLDVCNVLNLGPFQDEAETDEFLEGLNSLAKQLLDEFENLGNTKLLLERMNEILKANVDANPNLNVPEDIEETCSQEYEDVRDCNADVRTRSRSSVSTVVLEPDQTSDMTGEDRPPNLPYISKGRITKRKKIIKTEHNLESANKRHGLDLSRRHWGYFCLCGCKYSTRSTLKAHIKYMTSEWQFVCDICKKRFLFASGLRFHLDKAHQIVDLAHSACTCSVCGKSFDSLKELREHSRNMHPSTDIEGPGRSHSGRARGSCNARRGRHGAKVTGTRKVQVQGSTAAPLHGVDKRSSAIQCICGNIYSQKSALSMHISTKLYGKIFKCKDCGKRFTIHQELKKHALNVHKTDYLEGKYGCGICGEPFDSMMDLRIHRERGHKVEWGRRRGRGRGKKSFNKVTTDHPKVEISAFVDQDDDAPPPVLQMGANYGDRDDEVNQFNSNASDVDYEAYGDEDDMLPPSLEQQELTAPPIEFQVDEYSNNEDEVVYVE